MKRPGSNRIREKLLDFTNEMDKQMEARYKQAQEFVESLLAQDDIVKAVQRQPEWLHTGCRGCGQPDAAPGF